MKPLFLLGEAKGHNEAAINRGFVGAAGVELLKMLDEAKVITLTSEDFSFISKFWNEGKPEYIDMIWNMHPELYRTNVFQLHPPGNKLESFCGPKAEGIDGYPALLKSKYVRKEFQYELDRLGDELLAVDPNLVVALGNTALWALCGTTGVGKLRGATRLSTHTVSGFKVLPTYHPSGILRQWENRPPTILDFMKAAREAQFPEIRRLPREIWIEPTLEDLEVFYERYIVGSRSLSVDIETAGSRITCIGFAPSKQHALVIPFDDERSKSGCYWPTQHDELQAWRFVRRILTDRTIPKLFQNGLYDIAFLWRSVRIPVLGAEHDTMLLHHALQPESLKSLDFLGSIYTDEGSWKRDRRMKVKTIGRDK